LGITVAKVLYPSSIPPSNKACMSRFWPLAAILSLSCHSQEVERRIVEDLLEALLVMHDKVVHTLESVVKANSRYALIDLENMHENHYTPPPESRMVGRKVQFTIVLDFWSWKDNSLPKHQKSDATMTCTFLPTATILVFGGGVYGVFCMFSRSMRTYLPVALTTLLRRT
jgi:hypothetical protein